MTEIGDIVGRVKRDPGYSDSATRFDRGLASGASLFASCAWIVLTSPLLTIDSWLWLVVAVSPIVAVLLVSSSWVRLLVVVGGGLFVFGSSDELSASKLVYAGVLVLCAAVAAIRLATNPPIYSVAFRPLIVFGAAFCALLVANYLISPPGANIGVFARQSIFYLLVGVGIIVGLDTGRDLRPKAARLVVGGVGAFAAVGFMVDWLSRRGVTDLGVDRLVLSSLMLPAAGFALALVMTFHGATRLSRMTWAVLVIGIPTLMLASGTRTNVILFAALPFVVGSMANFRVPVGRLVPLVFFGVLIGWFGFELVTSIVISDPAFVESRAGSALTVLFGDAFEDQSFQERVVQQEIALSMIVERPLLGYGLGYTIPVTIDSPLLTVVRIGWIGAAIVVGSLVALARSIRRATVLFGHSPATTTWWGLLAVAIAYLPFGTPLEDRGFGFAVLLAVLAIGAHANHLSCTGSAPRKLSE